MTQLDRINELTKSLIVKPLGLALKERFDRLDAEFVERWPEAPTGPQPQQNPPTSPKDRI